MERVKYEEVFDTRVVGPRDNAGRCVLVSPPEKCDPGQYKAHVCKLVDHDLMVRGIVVINMF
jgi:hypothetical protein